MLEDNLLPFSFPAVERKKVTAAFDGGRITPEVIGPQARSPRREATAELSPAENLIKLHKAQLKSDRTSCRSPLANQMRLILHTAAYWLMLTVRDVVPETHALAKAEFATLRLRVLKIGARIRETAHRVRIAFAAACPEASLFRDIAIALRPAPA